MFVCYDKTDCFAIRISNLVKLLRNPLLGKSRDHLRAGYRSVQIEWHLAFYRVTENELELVRVLTFRWIQNFILELSCSLFLKTPMGERLNICIQSMNE
jgi:ParE toxin of type II toxin-antitoxin system, parDE